MYFSYAEKHKMERERFKIIGMRFAFGADKKDWKKFIEATETRKKPTKAGEISVKDLRKLSIPVVYKDADRK